MTLIGDDVPVRGLIANVVEMASAEARDRDVHLREEIEPGLPDLSADRQRLEQGVLNLVINAVQASGAGGEVVLRAAVSPADRGVDLIVDDSGAGIPDDVLGSIYEPFFTTKGGGHRARSGECQEDCRRARLFAARGEPAIGRRSLYAARAA